MADSSKLQKPTLAVGIATAITVAANKLVTDVDLRTQITTASPAVGTGAAWGLMWVRRQFAYWQLVRLEKKWLNEAIGERNKPNLTAKRMREIDADIAKRRESIENLQRENTKVQ